MADVFTFSGKDVLYGSVFLFLVVLGLSYFLSTLGPGSARGKPPLGAKSSCTCCANCTCKAVRLPMVRPMFPGQTGDMSSGVNDIPQ